MFRLVYFLRFLHYACCRSKSALKIPLCMYAMSRNIASSMLRSVPPVRHLHGRPVPYVGAHASWSPGAGVIVAAARNQMMFKRVLTYAWAGLFIALSSLCTPLCKQHTQHFAVQALAD